MGEFLLKVRHGAIKAPQQQRFTLSDWKKSFAETPTPDGDDHALLASGLCFAAEFEAARELTAKYAQASRHPRSRLVLLGLATYQWAVVKQQTAQALRESSANERFISEQAAEIRIVNPLGVAFDPVAAIESLVDGVRFPLSFLAPQTPPVPAQPAEENHFQALEAMFTLGPYYHTLEHWWLECVWNDYGTVCDETAIRIKPKPGGTHKAQAISRFRQATRRMEHAQRAMGQWINGLSKEFKQAILQKRFLLTSLKRNGKTRIKLRPAVESQNNLPPSFFNRVLLAHGYLDSVNDKSRNEFLGLSITNILDAYELLSHLPSQIYQFLPAIANLGSAQEAERYAPRIDRSELERTFSTALRVSARQAAWLLNFLSFKMTVRDQLWFRPLVQLSDSEVSVVVAAVDGVNFTRLNDHLLSELAEPEKEIGAYFEKHVRLKLKESAVAFKFRRCFSILSEGCEFAISSGQREQIDLVYRLGNRIFIGEIKAILSPASPLEAFRYIQRLTAEGAEQAKRKARFVAQHLTEFLQSIHLSQELDASSTLVSPLVVTNDFFMAGFELAGVPVADLAILTRYFEFGYLGKMAYTDDSGELIATSKHEFYRTENEAISSHEGYLRNPPQISLCEPYATLDDIDYKVPFGRRSLFCTQEYQVHYPYAELRAQFKKARGLRTGATE